jgi:hypothetical protein
MKNKKITGQSQDKIRQETITRQDKTRQNKKSQHNHKRRQAQEKASRRHLFWQSITAFDVGLICDFTCFCLKD